MNNDHDSKIVNNRVDRPGSVPGQSVNVHVQILDQ
jgi:hypothetical protein